MAEEQEQKSNFHLLTPEEVYSQELQSWKEYWDFSDSIYSNISNIAKQLVILPYQDIQLPIAISYLCTSSKWSKVLPILFSWGDKGTGKSTFAILASRLHGQKTTLSSADTFSSIRNTLDLMRWVDPETKQVEADNAMLCWDNIGPDTFLRDARLYQLLLFGYNRSTDQISIAQPDGTNKTYRVFCPKVMSSIHPLHSNPEFDELQRRLLIIRHKEFDKLTPAEREGTDATFSIMEDKLDIDNIDWTGINKILESFWDDEKNVREYIQLRMAISRRQKKKLPESFNAHRWTISIDLICTGIKIGCWSNPIDAIEAVGRYWEYIGNISKENEFNAVKLLRDFLNDETLGIQKMNEAAIKAGLEPEPLRVRTTKVKEFLSQQNQLGALDIQVQPHKIIPVMQQLGWILDRNEWIKR